MAILAVPSSQGERAQALRRYQFVRFDPCAPNSTPALSLQPPFC